MKNINTEIENELFGESDVVLNNVNDSGFICLGYNESTNYVWSNFKNCLFALTPKDFTKIVLINCFGSEFIETNYSEVKGNGKFSRVEVNYEKLSNDIINGCQKAGIYTSDKQKGKGVWLSKDGKVIINSEEIFSTDSSFNGSRIQKDATYIYKGTLGINKDSPEATTEELDLLFNLLNSYNFANKPEEVLLALGFLGQGFTTGLWSWLAHGYIFGEAGSGKSTLLKAMSKIWGENSIYKDGGTTEAYIRQKVGINTCVVAIDETEPERGRVEGHLSLFRGASDGSSIGRGTQSQTAVEYTLKFSGLLAGVIPVELRQADKGRIIPFKLLPLTDEDKKNIPNEIKLLLKDEDRLNELGKKVQMYLINNYAYISAVRNEIRNLIILSDISDRVSDTYSTIIALSYVLRKETCSFEDYLKIFNLQDKNEQLKGSKDHDEMFEEIMTYEIADKDNKDKMSIINYIYNAFYCFKHNNIVEFKQFNADLGKYGIRVLDSDKLEILIDSSRSSLKDILNKTRFNNGNIKEVLSRLSGVEIIAEPKMIGGVQKRNTIKITLNQDKYNYSKYEELRKIK